MTFPTYTFTLGAWAFTVIQDGQTAFTARDFFPEAPVGALARIMTAFGLADELPISINILLARHGDRLLLVDCGIGQDAGAGEGKLMAGLATLGVAPADIDAVIFTHAHWDHIGGAVDEAGERIFTNAHHFMPAAEWAYWSAPAIATREPGPSGQFAAAKLPRLAAVIETFRPGDAIFPAAVPGAGVTAVAAPGHTIGHAGLRFGGGPDQLLHFADAAHHPLQITYPNLAAAYDRDPAQAIASRNEIVTAAGAEGGLLLGYHFPFPGLGRVTAGATGQRWQTDA